MAWTGYMAHLTETCDEGAPRLVVHAEATPANVHEAVRTEPIHAALAGRLEWVPRNPAHTWLR